jgi:hypothetical protein
MNYNPSRQRKLFLYDCDKFHPSQAFYSSDLSTAEHLSSTTETIAPKLHPFVMKGDLLLGQRMSNRRVYSSAGKVSSMDPVQNQD